MVQRRSKTISPLQWLEIAKAEITNELYIEGTFVIKTQEDEDRIITEANAIRMRLFNEAQEKWKTIPDAEKERAWPRCSNISCNRTLICVGNGCQGFDY